MDFFALNIFIQICYFGFYCVDVLLDVCVFNNSQEQILNQQARRLISVQQQTLILIVYSNLHPVFTNKKNSERSDKSNRSHTHKKKKGCSQVTQVHKVLIT